MFPNDASNFSMLCIAIKRTLYLSKRRTFALMQCQSYKITTTQQYFTPTPLPLSPKGSLYFWQRNAPFNSDTLTDEEGRYVFLKGSLFGRTITLANVYAPNSHQVSFSRTVTNALSAFQEGMLILGGDFNVPLDPIHDTSTGTSSLSYAALKTIKSQLQTLVLHDTWRTLNPNGRDFTFFSAPHNKYSRIDYFFISQNDLPVLDHTSIDPMFLSDHHPISMTLALAEKRPSSHSWRLDPSLLTDPLIAADVELCLKQYFEENKPTDTSSLITLEAHK